MDDRWKEYERLACVEHERIYRGHTTLHWSEIPHEWLVDSVRPLEIISGHTFDECLITVCPPGLGRVVEYVMQTQE